MSNKPTIAFAVRIQLMDGNIMENSIGADTVFGAVKFVQDQAAEKGWSVAAILVQPFTDDDVVDAVEVAEVKQ
jgi:phosphohistidine swiveling domain-containing protein